MKKTLVFVGILIIVCLSVGVFLHNSFEANLNTIDKIINDEEVSKKDLGGLMFNHALNHKLSDITSNVEEYLNPNITSKKAEDYEKMSDSEKDAFMNDYLKKNKDLIKDYENALNYTSKIASTFEALNYEETKTKTILDKYISRIIEIKLSQKLSQTSVKLLIEDMELIKDVKFYSSAKSYITDEAIMNELNSLKTEYESKGDGEILIREFLPLAKELVEFKGDLSYNDIITPTEVIKFLEKNNAEKAICVNGIGGYYDDIQGEYTPYHTEYNSSVAKVSDTYINYDFYGDFMVKTRKTVFVRHNKGTENEELEEKQLSRYDKTNVDTYYKGDLINVSSGWLKDLSKEFNVDTDTLYICDGYGIKISKNSIETSGIKITY